MRTSTSTERDPDFDDMIYRTEVASCEGIVKELSRGYYDFDTMTERPYEDWRYKLTFQGGRYHNITFYGSVYLEYK